MQNREGTRRRQFLRGGFAIRRGHTLGSFSREVASRLKKNQTGSHRRVTASGGAPKNCDRLPPRCVLRVAKAVAPTRVTVTPRLVAMLSTAHATSLLICCDFYVTSYEQTNIYLKPG